jgi:hypothetical protein
MTPYICTVLNKRERRHFRYVTRKATKTARFALPRRAQQALHPQHRANICLPSKIVHPFSWLAASQGHGRRRNSRFPLVPQQWAADHRFDLFLGAVRAPVPVQGSAVYRPALD